ncbi:protein kinase family protein [Nocardia sp. NPDC047038]|uniref:protein kinase family protein n=1 Tax=Nocardia sp. NPDC047038 TaxID=3154338 RepID=UPI0033DB4E51
MTDPVELMLADLPEKYASTPPSPAYSRLYAEDMRFGVVFAHLHEQLNRHFTAINDRARSTRHYWAENSRELIALLDDLDETLATLRRAGVEVALRKGYAAAVERCRPWLSTSQGSTVPEDFETIELARFEPVFTRADNEHRLRKGGGVPVQLQLIGEGSYAKVFSFVDPDYGIKVALKRATTKDPRDLQRFREEFKVLQGLDFPYIVQVYRYHDSRDEYTMEYCDQTLRTYIGRRNQNLCFATRKRIALQFLYGIGYIHDQDLLHRDLSLQNVLLKVYKSKAVQVKLSDFGLVKDRTSEFTRTHTEIRGTILDPMLTSFRDYNIDNEVFAIGHILGYIFTGKQSLPRAADTDLHQLILRCTTLDLDRRPRNIREIITDVERLKDPAATPTN